MAPSVSKEHLIRGSESSIWGLSGFEMIEDDSHRFSERMWTVLNSKIFNSVIVILVLIEGLVIFAELLIDYDVIQDPLLKIPINCTSALNDTQSPFNSVSTRTNVSPSLITCKKVLAQLSLILVTIFLSEVLLRLFCGRTKFIAQPFELLDSLLVLVVFILDLIFYLYESDNFDSDYELARKQSGQEAALLIIVLRLWRVQKVVQCIVDDAQAKILHILMMCEKEKNHAEHKVDILILKVEDLEHEVAYLKEKAKKSEKESAAALHQISLVYKKPTAKRTESSNSNNSSASVSFCPCQKSGPLQSSSLASSTQHLHPRHDHSKGSLSSLARDHSSRNASVSILSIATVESGPEPSTTITTSIDLNKFALGLAQNITSDVVSALLRESAIYHPNSSSASSLLRLTNNNASNAASSNSIAHNSGSSKKAADARYKSTQRLLNHSPSEFLRRSSSSSMVSDAAPRFGLKAKNFRGEEPHTTPSSAAPGAGHGRSAPSMSSQELFASQSLAAAHQLNEEMEIERIKRVEFRQSDETDIPLTSL